MPGLDALASALFWLWFLLFPASPGYADILIDDLTQLRAPRSVRFDLAGSMRSLTDRTEVRASGAYVQPDRAQIALEAEGERYEAIMIGNTTYHRRGSESQWRAERSSGPAPPPRPPPDWPPVESRAVIEEILSEIKLIGTETLPVLRPAAIAGSLTCSAWPRSTALNLRPVRDVWP